MKNKLDDPILEEQRRQYGRFINQLDYRNEPHDLTLDQWFVLWQDHWNQRGRTSGSYCISRIDMTEPWSMDNVEVITRGEHLSRKNSRPRKHYV